MSELFPTAPSRFQAICEGLRALHLAEPHPWHVGVSGGKDSTLVAAVVFEAALANITCREQAGFGNADLSAAKRPVLASHADVIDACFVELPRAHGFKLANLDDGLRRRGWTIGVGENPL